MKSNLLLLTLVLMLVASCSDSELKINSAVTESATNDATTTTPALYNFSVSSVALSDRNAGLDRALTISYTEADNKLATTCQTASLSKLTIHTACACDGAGVCTVTVTGETGKLGSSAFNFRVGAGGEFSSWATISYNQICPSGYVEAPSDSAVGANNEFCVMRTEAKDVATYPASVTAGAPWVNIDPTDARAACYSLNTLNSVSNKYDLIANQEWMAIARDIEAQPSNWSNGTIGMGEALNRGHSDSTPNNPLAITDINDPYSDTGNNSGQAPTAGWEQKRTHTLSNGTVIWDFAGNVWEWADLNVSTVGLQILTDLTKKPYSSVDGAPINSYVEFSAIDRMIGENAGDVFLPAMWQPSNPAYGYLQGVGQYYAGDNTIGGAISRSGAYNDGYRSGIFTLALDTAVVGGGGSWGGFRCVYRP